MALKNLKEYVPPIKAHNAGIVKIDQLELTGIDTAPADANLAAGRIYFDTSDDTFYGYDGTSWKSFIVTVSGGAGTWDALYASDKTLTINSTTLTFAGTHATGDTTTFTATGSGDCIKITNSGSGYDISGNSDAWSIITSGGVAVVELGSGATINAAGGAMTLGLTGTATTLAGTLTVDETSTFTGAVTATASIVITGTANTTVFTITDGDLLVDDGSITITDTDEGGALVITSSSTTADTATITAAGTTSGSVLRLVTANATLSGGYYIECYDGAAIDFSVGENGAIVVEGSAPGTDSLTLSLGDATITSGDLVVSAGSVDITEDSTTNVALVVATAGTSVDAVTITADALTGTEAALSISVDALVDGRGIKVENVGEALTSGELLTILNTENGELATKTGNVISVTSDLEEDSGTVTSNYDVALFSRVDTQAHASQYDAQGSVVKILKTLDKAAGTIVDAVIALEVESAVANSALPLGNTVKITEVGVGATALNIVAAGTGADDVHIAGSGAHTSDKAVLNVTASGNIATGGNIVRVDAGAIDANGGAVFVEFDFAGVANTNEPTGVLIDAGGKKMVALSVDADPVVGSVALFHSDAVIADNNGVVHITSAGAIADGAAALRVAVTGTPAAATCYGMEVDFSSVTATNDPVAIFVNGTGKDVTGIKVDTDNTDIEAVAISGTGALTSAGNMLLVTNDGEPAASANVVQFSFTGTATNTPTILDLYGTGKDCQAISSDTDNTATHAVAITGTGVLTSAGSMLYVANDATNATDSFMVKFALTGTDTNNMGVLSIDADTYGAAISIDQDGTSANDQVAIAINTDNSSTGDQVALNITMVDESKSYFAKFANAVTAWTSTKSPETDAEAGWLKIDVNGTPYFVPFYAAS